MKLNNRWLLCVLNLQKNEPKYGQVVDLSREKNAICTCSVDLCCSCELYTMGSLSVWTVQLQLQATVASNPIFPGLSMPLFFWPVVVRREKLLGFSIEKLGDCACRHVWAIWDKNKGRGEWVKWVFGGGWENARVWGCTKGQEWENMRLDGRAGSRRTQTWGLGRKICACSHGPREIQENCSQT